MVDKRRLLDLALEKIHAEIAQLRATAEATAAGATHEEAKAENDKDTRALEQTYLARGQAQRVEESQEAATRLRFTELKAFSEDDPVGLGAIITLDVDSTERYYFLVPAAGGIRVELEGKTIQLLTAASPLGRALAGKVVGDAFELKLAGKEREYELVAIE